MKETKVILTGKRGYGVCVNGQVLIEGLSHQAAIAYARDYNELEAEKKKLGITAK